MRTFLTILFTLASLSLAQAHAFLDHAEPKVGSTVQVSPAVIKIWFTMQLNPDGSMIQVLDSKGVKVSRSQVKIDPIDGKLMTVSVPKLGAGSYRVVWTAVCHCCGDTTRGDFTFTVAGP
jgi:hypothetical protein